VRERIGAGEDGMRRESWGSWLKVTMVGGALLLGCGRSGHRSDDVPGPVSTVSRYAPIQDVPTDKDPPTDHELPSTGGEPAAPAPLPELLPESVRSAPWIGAARLRPEPVRVGVVQAHHLILTGPAEENRSASPASYAHATDYSWLSGELGYVAARGVWRLRYSTEGDRYGGSVTLAWAGTMTGWRSGQRVRVEGSLLDPTTEEPSPVYRVRTIRPFPEARE
jgi:hypothetical protein